MATDNNEATAWNGVMSGGNAPCKPDHSGPAIALGAAIGSITSLAAAGVGMLIRQDREIARKRKGK